MEADFWSRVRTDGALDAPEEPCWRCGVRADVGCKHRPAAGIAPRPVARVEDRRRADKGQGLGFHRERLASNLQAAIDSLKPGLRRVD
jgi:hypothetical protein